MTDADEKNPTPASDRPMSTLAKWSRTLAAGAMLGHAMLSDGCVCGCFVKGTRIATPRGVRTIDELAVGDLVFAFDTLKNVIVERPILDVLRAKRREILSIHAGELTVAGVTDDHPFWDAGARTWLRADQLTLAHTLLGWLGQGTPRVVGVTELRRARTSGEVEVFNLTVGGEEQNYFAEGVLVHNKSPAPNPVDAAQPDAGSETSDAR